MRRLILHIGLPKTGTTALQHFFTENRKLFGEQGILVPKTPQNVHRAYGVVFEASQPFPHERVWKQVRDLFAEKTDAVLVSHEDLSTHMAKNPEGVLRELVEYFSEIDVRIQIVVYLRRQDLHYESLYNQDVKYYCTSNTFNPTPEDDSIINSNGISLSIYHYYEWLHRIAEIIGKENAFIRIYDRASFAGGDIFHDFVSAIGIDYDDRFVLPAADPNPGIDSQYLELCRYANSVYSKDELTRQDTVDKILFYKFMLFINNQLGRTGDKGLFLDAERLKFLERFSESNRRLFEFIGRENIFSVEPLRHAEMKTARETLDALDLRKIVVLLHRRWLECSCGMSYPVRNYLRLKLAQIKMKKGDPGARRKLRRYRLIHSVGKRLVPGWPSTGEMEVVLREMPLDVN